MDAIKSMLAWIEERMEHQVLWRARYVHARGGLSDYDSGWYAGYLAALQSAGWQCEKIRDGKSDNRANWGR